MKILFMGTPFFAVASLEKLIKNKENLIGIVTQKDKPTGRGYHFKPSIIKEIALKKNLPLIQPDKINSKETIEKIKNLHPELIIVVSYGEILPKEILNFPQFGTVNLHPSLLPKYRGSAPIHWPIIQGEKETGITTIFLEKKIDAGKIILQEKIPIKENDTYGDLVITLSQQGAGLLLKTVELIKNDKVNPVLQDENKVSFAPSITNSDCIVNWSISAFAIYNLVRGLNPTPGAFTFWQSKRLKIWEVEVYLKDIQATYGEITFVEKDKVLVKTGDGQISLKTIQLENRKKMNIKEFLNGYKVKIGEILGNEL